MRALLIACLAGQGADAPATVGMPRRIEDLVIDGPQVVARAHVDPRAPIVVRILSAKRHGAAHRYSILYYGLVPGKHDLRDYLQRKEDGSPLTGVPPIVVDVRPAYEGQFRAVSDVELDPFAPAGGYRAALIALGALWIACVAAGAFVLLRRNKRRPVAADSTARPLTLAERLRPMVEKAARGGLTRDEQAELERMLLAFWRRREGLEQLEPAAALAELRRRETAGALLRALEEWLHAPRPAPVDVARLLAPYTEKEEFAA